MKNLMVVVIVLLAAVLVALLLNTYHHPAEAWSYKVVTPSDAKLTETLNQLGAEGWEVVSARRASDGSTINPTFLASCQPRQRPPVVST